MAHRPTPYSIALATLISLHCEENSPLYHNENGIDPDFTKVDSFIQFLMLESDDDSTTAKWGQLNATPVRTLLNQFVVCGICAETATLYGEWLKVAATSIDSLTDLMSTLQRSIAEGTIDAMSSNGIFVRGVCLGFDELSFESTVQLWMDFSTELKEADDNDPTIYQEWTLSSYQIEHALRKQCVVNGTRHVSVSASSVQRKLQKILDFNPELPSSHFMRFVSCLEAGERVGAIDALHQYVDYVLINNEQQTTSDGSSDANSAQRNEEILQFAAIIKTALHSSFGDRALAAAATEEACRVAQQSQDTACVAFALGWLAVHASDSHNASQLIQRCIQRATEANLRSLAAGANLTLASCQKLLQLQSTPSDDVATDYRPSRAIQCWNRWSDASSSDPTLSADADSSRWDRPLNMTHLASGEEALDILGRQRLVAAGIWDDYGQTAQSGLSSYIAIHNHGNKLPTQDINMAIQNIARRVILGSTSLVSMQSNENGYLLHKYLGSIEKNNNYILQVVEHDCVYGEAVRLMINLKEQYHLPIDGVFDIEIALVVHEWSVRRGDLLQADALNQALESHLNPRTPNYRQISVDIDSQKALLRVRQGRYEEAKQLLNDQVNNLRSNENTNQSAQLARLLLHASLVQLESSSEQQFTSSLSPLLECLSLTKDNNMDGLYAASLLVLAQVHFRRGNHKRCAAVIQAALPTLLQHEHVWFQAEAYLTLGKCILKQAKHQSEDDSIASNKPFHRILKLAVPKLQRSEELFRRCQDCLRLKEVYYLLARVYNSLPDSVIQRDEASKNFVRISQYLVQASNNEACQLLSSLTNVARLRKLAERPIPVVAVV